MQSSRTELFTGGTETAALMRAIDWSRHPLGPPETWPSSLRALVPVMLASRFAMRVLWGPSYLMLYNDAYRPVLGTSKHPQAMGQPTREHFPELWHIVGPLFDRVTAGESISLEDRQLPLERNGYFEECYFTLSYSPVPDDHGVTAGVLGVVYETTDRVLAERRLRTLRDLSGTAVAPSALLACHAAIEALRKNPEDVPFSLLYLVSPDGETAQLEGVAGIELPSALAPARIAITAAAPWPLGEIAGTRGLTAIDVPARFGVVHAGAYPEPLTGAIGIPIYAPDATVPSAFFIAGQNPRRVLDAKYRTFFELASEQITSSLLNAMIAEERTRMVSRERAADERLRSLFKDAPAAIAVLRGPEHVFELANPMYRRLVGRAELVGRTLREALPELVGQGIVEQLDRVLSTGEPYVAKALPVGLARRDDGGLDQGYFNFTVQPLLDMDGAPEGVVVFAIEITDLVAARAEAEQSNRAKDEFLAVVSHELRNPLSAILGWTRMLQNGHLPDDKRVRALETIERNAVNQSQLIEDLLDISRIVAGTLRLEISTVNFVDLINNALDSARPAIDAKQLVLKVVLDTASSLLLADASRLQQVVWNLLTNATKFTPRGGKITVTLTREESLLVLEVRDTGAGVSPEFLPHVFERFKQADSTTTRKHGGLGLGLAISRNIVEMHGGTIEARSDGLGLGAAFLVRLPVAPTRAPARDAEPRLPAPVLECPPELDGLHVLVVDDDADGRQMIGFVLERCGSRVTLAGSVREALAAFDADRPDVVLSDIGMPELDGYALIRDLRARPPAAGGTVPAASLTAYAGVEDRRRALNAGFNMHVPKPVEPAELVTVIASLARFARALK